MVSNGLSAVSAADMSLKASVSAPPAAKSYKCLSNSILHRVLPLPISPLETIKKDAKFEVAAWERCQKYDTERIAAGIFYS